jgi:hypothetical protein
MACTEHGTKGADAKLLKKDVLADALLCMHASQYPASPTGDRARDTTR